ncbi:hypothetical protein COP1_034927 [Malus domestica]
MVYAYTSMTKMVNPAGWSDDNHPECNNYVACKEYTNNSSLSLALDIFRVVNCPENGGEGYNLFNLSKIVAYKLSWLVRIRVNKASSV